MNVPLLDLQAQNQPLEPELKAVFDSVLRSGRFILGPEVEALEASIAALSGATYGIGVSSGTDAILLALMALEIGPGDEVLCPTFTFFATAGCIARTGATPVWVDIDPVSFNIDVTKAEAKITDRTKAIIPVHLYGQAADMDAVMALAAKYSLKVIEDTAQAIHAGYKGKWVGGMGDFGTISFYPTKNLGAFGDAGLLTANDTDLAQKARWLRNHGDVARYVHTYVGGNFRLDALQAALLRVKLPYFASYVERRRAHAQTYLQELSKLPGVVIASEADVTTPYSDLAAREQSAGIKMVLPIELSGRYHTWNQFTVRILGDGRRDAVRDFLRSKNIGCETYYPVTMDQQECFRSIGKGSDSLEVAHAFTTQTLSIPVYPELSAEQQAYVITSVAEALAL
ncbi:MAG: DegT/DnrJ/EryC1/StrS family aminotransferase [Opitutales bacterium]|nr:DegT/DnrJ/EryC1/StrS family aminotransferase [Opitutales bacterium]